MCSQKLSFSLIQDDHFKVLFNEEELDIINKNIPWTRVLGKYKTCYHDKQVNLVDFIKLNRQNFVLKPNYGYGGKGILLGPEIRQEDWERNINLIMNSGSKYVVQEYINIPMESFPVCSNDTFKGFSKKYFNINFWGFNGKFGGSYVRTSEKKIINVSQGGKMIPLYFVDN